MSAMNDGRSPIKDQRSKRTRDGASPDDPFADVYMFKKLSLWQKAQDLAEAVLDLVATLPNDRTTTVLMQQIVRSSTSIAANIAEGHGRFTLAAYRFHLSVARGSTAETISWVDLLKRRGLISGAQESALMNALAQLMRLISAKMIDLDARINAASSRTRGARALHDERGAYVVDHEDEAGKDLFFDL